MSILQVNLGNYANDGTGDDLRSAFEKVNANFSEIDLTRVITAENLGNGSPLFYDKVNNILRFRSIVGGNNISLIYNNDEITVSTVNLLSSVEGDLAPRLGGDLDINSWQIYGNGNIDIVGDIVATSFTGNVTGNVTGTVSDISNHDLADLGNVDPTAPQVGQVLVWNGAAWIPGENGGGGSGDIGSEYDFGILNVTPTDPLQLVLQFTPIDFDTISFSSNNTLDFGLIDPFAVSYILYKSADSVVEGDSITITLATTNVANATEIPYTITGVQADDIVGGVLSGVFTINNNLATLVLTIATDLDIELNDVATLTLDGFDPVISVSFTIVDLSAEIDGGSPGSIVFSTIFDGGSPSTTAFDSIIDGGDPTDPNVISGGLPGTTIFALIADGGNPATIEFDTMYDGGLPA
jgi:hypothetical protein